MPGEPTLAEVIREAITSRLLDVHTALPGRVEKYDAATQTADVLPMVVRSVPARAGGYDTEELPVIPNVPLAWPRGGGCALHFPIEKGDFVLLVFSEAATSQWRESGDLSEPGDLRRHHLSYPFAIPGIAPNAGKLADAPASDEAVVLVPSGGSLRVSTPGATAPAVQEVVLFEKLKLALQAVMTAGSGGAAPTDGGKAAFTAAASAIESWTPEIVAATTLKAEG